MDLKGDSIVAQLCKWARNRWRWLQKSSPVDHPISHQCWSITVRQYCHRAACFYFWGIFLFTFFRFLFLLLASNQFPIYFQHFWHPLGVEFLAAPANDFSLFCGVWSLMVSPENTNWLYDYGFDDIPVPGGNFSGPTSGFSWPAQAFIGSSNVRWCFRFYLIFNRQGLCLWEVLVNLLLVYCFEFFHSSLFMVSSSSSSSHCVLEILIIVLFIDDSYNWISLIGLDTLR